MFNDPFSKYCSTLEAEKVTKSGTGGKKSDKYRALPEEIYMQWKSGSSQAEPVRLHLCEA